MRICWLGLGLAVLVLAGCRKSPGWEREGEKPRPPKREPHAAALEDSIADLERAADLLATIHDRQSARAVDPKLRAVARRLRQTVERSLALGKPSRKMERRLAREFNEPLRNAAERLRQERARVRAIPGVSSALRRSLAEFKKIADLQKPKAP
jgi:hypothetical protein